MTFANCMFFVLSSAFQVLLFDKTDERRRRITLDEDTKMKEPAGYDFGDRFGLALGDEDMAGDNGGYDMSCSMTLNYNAWF